jgi:hypothetical protein
MKGSGFELDSIHGGAVGSPFNHNEMIVGFLDFRNLHWFLSFSSISISIRVLVLVLVLVSVSVSVPPLKIAVEKQGNINMDIRAID